MKEQKSYSIEDAGRMLGMRADLVAVAVRGTLGGRVLPGDPLRAVDVLELALFLRRPVPAEIDKALGLEGVRQSQPAKGQAADLTTQKNAGMKAGEERWSLAEVAAWLHLSQDSLRFLIERGAAGDVSFVGDGRAIELTAGNLRMLRSRLLAAVDTHGGTVAFAAAKRGGR